MNSVAYGYDPHAFISRGGGRSVLLTAAPSVDGARLLEDIGRAKLDAGLGVMYGSGLAGVDWAGIDWAGVPTFARGVLITRPLSSNSGPF